MILKYIFFHATISFVLSLQKFRVVAFASLHVVSGQAEQQRQQSGAQRVLEQGPEVVMLAEQLRPAAEHLVQQVQR